MTVCTLGDKTKTEGLPAADYYQPGLSNHHKAPAIVGSLWIPIRSWGGGNAPGMFLRLVTSSDMQHTQRQCDHIRWPPGR